MPRSRSPLSGVLSALSDGTRARLARVVSFGLVGGIAFIVDVGAYNVLRATVLDDKPIGAKVVSVALATLVAWIGNRHLTFRAERSRPAVREAMLFGVMNVLGLLIAAACLFVSHYLLGFTSQLADNIAGNGVGLVLGMLFRYWAYRVIVFRPAREPSATPVPSPSPVLPARDRGRDRAGASADARLAVVGTADSRA